MMNIEIEQEIDGRWIAEVAEIPGLLAYGRSQENAIELVHALLDAVIADRLANGEEVPNID